MAKRQTIGNNPFDSYFSPVSTTKAEQAEAPKKVERARICVDIPAELLDKLKDAVYWTPGTTLASVAELAFMKAIKDMEKERKAGFPKRKGELKTGRPLS